MEVVIQTKTDRYVFPEAEFIEIDKCALEICAESDPRDIVVIKAAEEAER